MLPKGDVTLRGQLAADGTMTVEQGDMTLISGRASSILRQHPQDGLEVGRDNGGSVGRYQVPFALQGTVHELVITR